MEKIKKISELQSAFTISSDDEFIVIDKSIREGDDASNSGKTSKVTLAKLKEGLFPAGIPNGEKGEPGANGTDGEKGISGIDGTDGEKGEPGIPGSDGPAGPPGTNGGIGPQGPFGPRGYQGTQGNSGVRMEISNGVLTFITQ